MILGTIGLLVSSEIQKKRGIKKKKWHERGRQKVYCENNQEDVVSVAFIQMQR